MTATVDRALALWGLTGSDCALVAARENAVYRVTSNDTCVALRLHRQGYRTDAELWSELCWMEAVSQGGLSVPAPIASATGAMLHVVDGVQVDVLTWLSGTTLDDQLTACSPDQRASFFGALGEAMARLHQASDAWTPPPGFTRIAWDRRGLLGDAPLWGRFWDNPQLTPDNRALMHRLREQADAALAPQESALDYGLIHADLVAANVMVDGPQMHLIDFDDGGYGFRLFDIATALLKHRDASDYPALRDALIAGYTRHRPIDLATLDLFMVLRAATYVGWNVTRMDEAGGHARNARFIATACQLAASFCDAP